MDIAMLICQQVCPISNYTWKGTSCQQCLLYIFYRVLLLAGEDDLRDVRSAVADLAAKWKDLSISLGIGLSDLDAIFSASPHSPNDCLREMLAFWLKQNYNVRTTLMLPHCTMSHYMGQASLTILSALIT